MHRRSYPPAQTVAQTVVDHFRRHAAASPLLPDAATVERIINAAFWASLRRDEGRSPKISIAFLPPGAAGTSLMMERPLPLDPGALTRLAPAVERPGIHLGVWHANGDLAVWGATRSIPPLCFVVEVVEPGLLVVKHRRADPGGKFGNVAVLESDQVKIVDVEGTLASECPDFVTALLGFDSGAGGSESILLPLALSMRAHGHGGSLLVVPHGTDAWRQSILWPVPYAVAPPYSRLSELLRAAQGERSEGAWHEAFRAATDAIGGLTAVDGAVVLSDRWEVLAFGAKIGRSHAATVVDQVLVREPIVGSAPVTVHLSDLGGTRHQSAAQFVHEQRDALALVASQDGRFTAFGWSERDAMVRAYRVEALLL